MLLSDVFYEYKQSCEFLKNYTINIEKVTNTLNHVWIENEENTIEIAIEENEGYASLLIERKPNKKYYYALSDYSYIDGANDMFNGLNGSINKDEFYQEVRNCVKMQKSLENKMPTK